MQKGHVTYRFRDGNLRLGSSKDTHIIRSKIGVCPQMNTSLQEDLTARETLRLFAQLKGGMPRSGSNQTVEKAVDEEVERRLNEVQFTTPSDVDKEVGTYSGGMKRKVLIALALLGDPEIVFLDGAYAA